MTIESREEAVRFALDGREIALCVFVAAARLEEILDRRSVGQHRSINRDFRQILSKALLVDSRTLRFLARDAQFIERRLQALRQPRERIRAGR